MGPTIPRIGEHAPFVGEYVIPADGPRANRRVSRNGVRGDWPAGTVSSSRMFFVLIEIRSPVTYLLAFPFQIIQRGAVLFGLLLDHAGSTAVDEVFRFDRLQRIVFVTRSKNLAASAAATC